MDANRGGFSHTQQRRWLSKALSYAWLLFILTLAAGLRFYHLGFESFWRDELYSRHSGAYATLRDVVIKGAAEDVHPPGYPLVMYATLRLVGDSETALRLPSALAGCLAVYLLYALGATLFSKRVGLSGAALLAVSQFAVQYSQECRAYSLLLTATLGFALACAKVVELHKQNQRTPLLLLTLFMSGVVASYLHYFGLLFVALAAPVFIALALRGEVPRCAVLLLYLGFVLAYGPWISLVLAQVSRAHVWMRVPTLESIRTTIDAFTRYRSHWSSFWTLLFIRTTTGPAQGAVPRGGGFPGRARRSISSSPARDYRPQRLRSRLQLLLRTLELSVACRRKSEASRSSFGHGRGLVRHPQT